MTINILIKLRFVIVILLMSHRVIGADWCPYCMKVKDYLENKKVKFDWIDTETPEGAKIR